METDVCLVRMKHEMSKGNAMNASRDIYASLWRTEEFARSAAEDRETSDPCL